MKDGPNRIATWLLAITVITTVIMLLVALVAIPRILETSEDTDAIRQGNALAACRAIYTDRLDNAKYRVQDLFLQGLVAATQDDDVRVLAIVDEVQEARTLVAQRTDERTVAAARSAEEPERFLRDCRELTSGRG
jgi:hypothetical protein